MATMPKPTLVSERPQPLRARDVEKFLARYKEAWETRNPELAASLFTRDVRYFQTPFAEPIVGREAVHNYWSAATQHQQEICFTVTHCLHKGFLVSAEWKCTYRDALDGSRKELAGMFIADFWGKQVRTFREYYASRKL
jgi:hypothetical protein